LYPSPYKACNAFKTSTTDISFRETENQLSLTSVLNRQISWLTPSLTFGCAAAQINRFGCHRNISGLLQAQQPPGLQITKEPLKTNHIKESPVISSSLLMLTGVNKPLLLLSKLRRIVCRPLPRTATVTVVALPNAPRQGYNQLVLLSLKITWPRK